MCVIFSVVTVFGQQKGHPNLRGPKNALSGDKHGCYTLVAKGYATIDSNQESLKRHKLAFFYPQQTEPEQLRPFQKGSSTLHHHNNSSLLNSWKSPEKWLG